MATETLKPTLSQFERESSSLSSVRRASVVAPSGGIDIDRQNLTLQIDGKEINIAKKSSYTTRDILSMIRLAKGLTDPHLISPLIKDLVGSKAVTAEKVNFEGKMTYGFREENLTVLINALLPRIDLYVSLPKEPIILPDGQRLDKLTTLQYMLMGLLTKAKKRQDTVRESYLIALYQGLPKEKAIARARGYMYAMRMKLKPYGWMIKNHTSRPAVTRGEESRYELVSISDHWCKQAQEQREKNIQASLGTDFIPDALSKNPPTEKAREIREYAIASAKENLELQCTSIILTHLLINGNLRQFEPDLRKFLNSNLTIRRPYKISLQPHIIKVSKPRHSAKQVERFFINFLRKRLKDADSIPTQEEANSHLEKDIKCAYDNITLENKKDKTEGLIQIACKHFGIQYKKPPEPPTSSPES